MFYFSLFWTDSRNFFLSFFKLSISLRALFSSFWKSTEWFFLFRQQQMFPVVDLKNHFASSLKCGANPLSQFACCHCFLLRIPSQIVHGPFLSRQKLVLYTLIWNYVLKKDYRLCCHICWVSDHFTVMSVSLGLLTVVIHNDFLHFSVFQSLNSKITVSIA